MKKPRTNKLEAHAIAYELHYISIEAKNVANHMISTGRKNFVFHGRELLVAANTMLQWENNIRKATQSKKS